MTIEEIRAKEEITIEELEAEIDRREDLIFYEQMSDRCDNQKINNIRKNIHEIEQMIERLKNAKTE